MIFINFIYIIMTIIALYVYTFSIANHSSRISNIFIVFMLVQIVVNLSVFILIPIESATLTQWYISYKIKNLALAFLPMILTFFMYEYLHIRYNKKLICIYAISVGVFFIESAMLTLNVFLDSVLVKVLSKNIFGILSIYSITSIIFVIFSFVLILYLTLVYILYVKDKKVPFKIEIIVLTICLLFMLLSQIYIHKQAIYSVDITFIFSIIITVCFLKLIIDNDIQDVIPVSNSKIIDTLPSPILILNSKDKIVYGNKIAYEVIQFLDVGENLINIPSVVAYNTKDDVLENKSIVLKNFNTNETHTYLINVENYDNKYKYLIFQDATNIKEKILKLHKKSMIDGLTGLFNKTTFNNNVELEIAKPLNNKKFKVMFMIDLDHFKAINDSYGHKVGDEVLITLAKYLKNIFKNDYIIGRFGGEEFCGFIFTNNKNDVYQNLKKLRNTFKEQKFVVKNEEFYVTLSIGVVFDNTNIKEVDKLIARADLALYMAKRSGRDRVVIYDETMKM